MFEDARLEEFPRQEQRLWRVRGGTPKVMAVPVEMEPKCMSAIPHSEISSQKAPSRWSRRDTTHFYTSPCILQDTKVVPRRRYIGLETIVLLAVLQASLSGLKAGSSNLVPEH